MLFGLDRSTDEQSLVTFLRLFSQDRLLGTLAPRMREEEIHQVVDLLTEIITITDPLARPSADTPHACTCQPA
jgi:hypothetical protein